MLYYAYGAISPLKYIVVVAHIYPPVTVQHQTLTYWAFRTLFIAVNTLLLEESTPLITHRAYKEYNTCYNRRVTGTRNC